jgi:acetyl esterase/lipase
LAAPRKSGNRLILVPLRPKICVWLVALSLALTACSAIELDIFNLPVPRQGYRRVSDLVYGPLPEQQLDVYIPQPAPQAAPVVVFLHGGSWTFGDKDGYRFVGQALTARGFVVMVADFRQYPGVRFPAFLEDAARALVFAHHHAADYGGDPAQLFVMGHSSGAHMAAMLALDPHYLAALGLSPAILRGVVGLAGPYDFLPFTEENVKDIFAPANADLAQTQPITFVSRQAPDFLLLQGADDIDVSPHNSDSLAARLREAGATVEEHVYPKMAHLGVLLDLAPLLRDRAPVLDDITYFIERRRGGAKQSCFVAMRCRRRE